ncbi:transposase, partial [Escherichia coli]
STHHLEMVFVWKQNYILVDEYFFFCCTWIVNSAFPEPHQPWTRGTNENTNGLLREYFPKHQDINQWSEVDIQQVINKLNLRPRKCLGWKTPYEVYFKKSLHLV